MKTFLALGSTWMPVAIATVVLIGALTLASRPVEATQAMAQKTGKGCTTCHSVLPALNRTGEAYKATGKLPSSGRK